MWLWREKWNEYNEAALIRLAARFLVATILMAFIVAAFGVGGFAWSAKRGFGIGFLVLETVGVLGVIFMTTCLYLHGRADDASQRRGR